MSKPKVICLTPVKNERWILDRFLRCASEWADHIIVADQASDDGSREIALRHAKVTLVDNPSPTFNEPERQKILLAAARRIPGPRLLIALDADEMLTANFSTSPEWSTILDAPPGTVILFQWPIIGPDLRTCWMPPAAQAFGFMDDESEHSGRVIHSPRIPVSPQAPTITLREIKAMHYVGVDLERWKKKHIWYQCWERVNQPHRRATDIYRQYHRIDAIPSREIRDIPDQWLSGYVRKGIDMTSIYREGILHVERQILSFLLEHGPERFRREAIWDIDWSKVHEKIHGVPPERPLKDPRNTFDRYVHRWLGKTEKYFSYFAEEPSLREAFTLRIVGRLLRLLGW